MGISRFSCNVLELNAHFDKLLNASATWAAPTKRNEVLKWQGEGRSLQGTAELV